MIQLTSRGDYGILAVYYIASQKKDSFISIDEIAENTNIPKPYLGKILQQLCRGGILFSRRGAGGGFTLARPAHDLSIKDILEVIEGKIALVRCLKNPSQCPGGVNGCRMSPVWKGVQNVMLEILGSLTLEDLIDTENHQEMLASLQQCRILYREKMREITAQRNVTRKKKILEKF